MHSGMDSDHARRIRVETRGAPMTSPNARHEETRGEVIVNSFLDSLGDYTVPYYVIRQNKCETRGRSGMSILSTHNTKDLSSLKPLGKATVDVLIHTSTYDLDPPDQSWIPAAKARNAARAAAQCDAICASLDACANGQATCVIGRCALKGVMYSLLRTVGLIVILPALTSRNPARVPTPSSFPG